MQHKADASFNSVGKSGKDVVYHDPLLHLFKLLMKIDRRVNGTPQLNDNSEVSNESNKRNTNSADKAD
jgi:hypothetical protein